METIIHPAYERSQIAIRYYRKIGRIYSSKEKAWNNFRRKNHRPDPEILAKVYDEILKESKEMLGEFFNLKLKNT